MSNMNKMETYIIISKLLDMGEEELAGKMLKIVVESSHSKTSFQYVPTFSPKDTKDINSVINRVNKSVKHLQMVD